MTGRDKAGLNQSVYHALEIIDYLTGKDWSRVKDIAQALGLDTARVHRLLNTMLHMDYIEYDPKTRLYRLGMKFYSISYHMSKDHSLVNVAREHMEWAAGQLCETINLGMLSSNHMEMTHVYRLDGNAKALQGLSPIGSSKSLHASAIGKAILAFRPLREQQGIVPRLDYVKYTDTTICTQEGLLEELGAVAEQGYAVDDGEYHKDMFCIAYPVFSAGGISEAGISVTTLRPCPPERQEQFKAVLAQAAKRISAALKRG